MSAMRAAVIVFPGSNCDRDVAVALAKATGTAPAMIWHRETELPALDLIVLPGGFAYGDYLRAGAMAAQSPAVREVVARAEAGVAVLGICNGFQVLTECRLLPGALMRNRDLRFLCRTVELAVETRRLLRRRAHPRGARGRGPRRLPLCRRERAHRRRRRASRAQRRLPRHRRNPRRIAHRARHDAAPRAGDRARARRQRRRPPVRRPRRAPAIAPSRMMPHPERAIEPALGGSDGARLFAGLVERLQ
jgi:phosphoribosylformylglycinamidine synthase